MRRDATRYDAMRRDACDGGCKVLTALMVEGATSSTTDLNYDTLPHPFVSPSTATPILPFFGDFEVAID